MKKPTIFISSRKPGVEEISSIARCKKNIYGPPNPPEWIERPVKVTSLNASELEIVQRPGVLGPLKAGEYTNDQAGGYPPYHLRFEQAFKNA